MTPKLALWLTWIGIGAFVAGYAVAQSNRGPNVLTGCVYNSSPPTLTTGQTVTLQCDVNGKLKVNTS